MSKRRRIGESRNVKSIQAIANEHNISYYSALKAFNNAKLYCNTFNDKTVLQCVEETLGRTSYQQSKPR
jgi:hypothetical protein